MTMWPHLYETHIVATRVISNEGAAAVYPKWLVTGPGFYLILRNNTTGAVFAVDCEILRGETIIIDTDPTQRTTIGSIQGSLHACCFVPGSDYWPLVAGDNSIYVELGRTLPESHITLQRVPR